MDEILGLAIVKMIDKQITVCSDVKTQIYKKHGNIRHVTNNNLRNSDIQSQRNVMDTRLEINWLLQNKARCSTTEFEQII